MTCNGGDKHKKGDREHVEVVSSTESSEERQGKVVKVVVWFKSKSKSNNARKRDKQGTS